VPESKTDEILRRANNVLARVERMKNGEAPETPPPACVAPSRPPHSHVNVNSYPNHSRGLLPPVSPHAAPTSSMVLVLSKQVFISLSASRINFFSGFELFLELSCSAK